MARLEPLLPREIVVVRDASWFWNIANTHRFPAGKAAKRSRTSISWLGGLSHPRGSNIKLGGHTRSAIQ